MSVIVKVIATRLLEHGALGVPAEIVCAEVTGKLHPYATFQRNIGQEPYWGHYFKTRAEAMKDFNTR